MPERDEHEGFTPQKVGENGPHFIEALEGTADYWLSLTDAARVTRRQEVTIRRWVAAGILPVRRQAVGINQRTRHVRASDLARLTPIVDPTAAITGAPANADLLSIPVQQAILMTEQQDMRQRLADLLQRDETFSRHLQTQEAAQQQALTAMSERLAEVRDQFREDLVRQHALQEERMRLIQARMEVTHQQIIDAMAQDHHDWQMRFATTDTALERLAAADTDLQQKYERAEKGWQDAITEHVQYVEKEIRRQEDERMVLRQEFAHFQQQGEQLSASLQRMTHDHDAHQQDIQNVQHLLQQSREDQMHRQHQQAVQMTVLAAQIRRHRVSRWRSRPKARVEGESHH